MARDNIKKVFASIKKDVKVAATKAMDSGAQILPQILQENINEWGARGGRSRWPRVNPFWLAQRQTWPGGAIGRKGNNQLAFTSAQVAYLQSHKPLIDTGTLFNSMQWARVSQDKWIGFAGASYARNQILGIPGPNGPNQMHPRDFAFKVDGADDDRILLAVQIAFWRLVANG